MNKSDIMKAAERAEERLEAGVAHEWQAIKQTTEALIAAAELLKQVEDKLSTLTSEAGRDYCKALQNAEDYPNLKGEQWKIDNGEFKIENLQAHKDNCRLLGRHFGIMYAVNSLRPVILEKEGV